MPEITLNCAWHRKKTERTFSNNMNAALLSFFSLEFEMLSAGYYFRGIIYKKAICVEL